MSPPIDAEVALEVERREDFLAMMLALKFGAWRLTVSIDGIGRGFLCVVPAALRPGSTGSKCWQKRLATCFPGGARSGSTVLGMSISTIGSRD